ncbi:MAG TPA: hypothetical protein VFD58_14470 [Blastocatellia bacterium]|nr:hypothetical protein [Blastocatellia bacterium]
MLSRIAQCLFFVMVVSLAPLAQTQTATNPQERPTRTSIIIERQLVRFATAGEALELRLVVADQQGEVVFDSGYVNAVSLDWPLTSQQGEAIASGLYTWTLSTKAATDEAARTQQGQVIIDRASSNDRVWVTGSSQTGLGADSQAPKVIVVGGSQTAIAGTELPSGSASGIGERAFTHRTVLPEAGKQEAKEVASISGTNAVNISGTGTTNRIAKWTNGPSGVLGDSSIAEVGGKVGIGTASPGTKLDIQGNVSTFNGVALALTNANAGNTNPWVLGTGGSVVAKDAFSIGDSSSYKMTFLPNGSVGIGTTSPGFRLHVVDPANTGLRVQTSSAGGTVASFGGNGDFQIDAVNVVGGRLIVKENGSVGIGTSAPAAKLDVQSNDVYPTAAISARGGASSDPDGAGGTGVHAIGGYGSNGAHSGIGLYAEAGFADFSTGSSNGWAGYFAGPVYMEGNVTVVGNLYATGSKNFKIDHPLDPENKYLIHAAIESSEVLNVYSGNVSLGPDGMGLVTLPDWFEALNRDFRYQLTAIGAPAQGLYIAEEINQNQFRIAGGVPGMKVSWQVTGVRSDAVMLQRPFKAEQDKPAGERGTYLTPEAFGQPEEKGVEWAQHPELLRQMKQRREQAQKQKAQPPNP